MFDEESVDIDTFLFPVMETIVNSRSLSDGQEKEEKRNGNEVL